MVSIVINKYVIYYTWVSAFILMDVTRTWRTIGSKRLTIEHRWSQSSMTTVHCPSNWVRRAEWSYPLLVVALPTMNYAPFAPLSGCGSCIIFPVCRCSGFGATFLLYLGLISPNLLPSQSAWSSSFPLSRPPPPHSLSLSPLSHFLTISFPLVTFQLFFLARFLFYALFLHDRGVLPGEFKCCIMDNIGVLASLSELSTKENIIHLHF